MQTATNLTVAAQENLVKINYEVPREFSHECLCEANALPARILKEDRAGRIDMTDLCLITIDGEDAKDFDDAICVSKENNTYTLYVAIADVAHYVKSNHKKNSLDYEARLRANSRYFPTSVCPMLPEILSSNLCSLKPNEDRLAILVKIIFTKQGKIKKTKFLPIIMNSHARLTYNLVKDIILDKKLKAIESFKKQPFGTQIIEMLNTAFELFKILQKKRKERGSLNFEIPDIKCILTKTGYVKTLEHDIRNDAHKLIEEFMIVANESVANFLEEQEYQFPYRIHPKPDQEKIQALQNFSGSTDIHKILEHAKNTPNESLINRLCLRAMSQAKYQIHNEGHFGLASKAYCHFTSPIRRYADLLVHRALRTSIGMDEKKLLAGKKLIRITDQLNKIERETIECEREMNKRLSCLSMLSHIGDRFFGTISSIMRFGIFVELDSIPVEGMIKINDMGKDHYIIHKDNLFMTGKKTGITWYIGDKIEVRIARVDMIRLEITLMPLELPKKRKKRK